MIVRFAPRAQHYFMRNHHNDPKRFQTDNSMSVVIYDEKKDDWAKILYSDALANATSLVFNGGGINESNFVSPPEDFIFTCRDTNYKGDESHQFVKWWGQLEQGGVDGQDLPDHLPQEAIRAHAQSVEARIKEASTPVNDIAGALNAAFALLATADETEVNGIGLAVAPGGVVAPALNAFMGPIEALLKYYPSLNLNSSSAVASGYANHFEQVALNIIFPRPALYGRGDEAPAAPFVTIPFLDATFGPGEVTMDNVLPSGTAPGAPGMHADDNEARAFMYLFERDGLTKSQAKNFKKEVGGKLKKAYAAAKKATENWGGRGMMANPALLTRAAIRDAVLNPGTKFIQWRKEGGTAGLIAVDTIADELLAAFPAINSPAAGGAGLRAALGAVTATAHLGEEFSIGSKRPASSANEQWSKRQGVGADAQDASAFMEGIGARFDDIKGRRRAGGFLPTRADVKKMDKHNWVLSSDHALFHAQNKVQHFARKVGNLATPIQRLAAHMLYWSKVTKESMQAWAVNDIVPPFSICLARPWMTYDMNTCILMKGGSETGNTFQGHSDFQLGDDVQSKIHYGNYTYYSKAIVTQHKNIIHARNVYCSGYVDGDCTEWARVNSNGDREGGSLLAFIVPYNEHKKSNPMRLFSESEVDPHTRPEHRFGRSMTGAQYYRALLNFNHNTIVGADQFTTLSEQNDSNDITYQGHTFFWKEHREAGVNGSYTGVTVNTGHWGRDVYPGCGRVRNGEEVYFEKQHHGQDVY